jgi:tRNA(Ile)-lysidine synthase
MNEIIRPIYEKALVSSGSHRVELAISALTALPEAAGRRVIRMAIVQVKGDLLRISFSHIEAARELAQRQQFPAQLMLPDGIRIQRNKSLLTVYQVEEPLRKSRLEIRPRQASFFYSVSGPAGRVTITETGAELTFSEIPIGSGKMDDLSGKIALLDLDLLEFPLILRNIQPGDRFNPLGVTGTQKVQKYFIDHKIDCTERRQCPVLLSGNAVAWLAGHRISGLFKITPSTRRVLRIEICRPALSALA